MVAYNFYTSPDSPMHSVTDRRTNGRTDRQTDGRQDDANSRSCYVAVRSANKKAKLSQSISVNCMLQKSSHSDNYFLHNV